MGRLLRIESTYRKPSVEVFLTQQQSRPGGTECLIPSYFLARLGRKPSRDNSLSIAFSLDYPGPLSLVNHLPANGKIMRVFQGSQSFQSRVSIMVFQGSQTFQSTVSITLCFSLLYLSSSSQKVNSEVSSCTNTRLNLILFLR